MLLQQIISQSNAGNRTYDVFSSNYIDTEGISSELKALDPFFTYSIVYNSDDNHWYFGTLTTGGSPYNRASLIYRINSSLEVVDTYLIPLDVSITSSYDTHPSPVLFIDSDFNLWVCREKCKNSTGTSDGHNTDWLIYKTSTPSDLSSLALHKTITGRFSYPNIQVYADTVYVSGRGKVGGTALNIFNLQKSTDGGVNFTNLPVYTTSSSNRAYTQAIHNYDNNDLIFASNMRNDPLAAFVSVHVIKSSNGIVWKNIQEDFSKNIQSAGMLNINDLNANCLVWESPTEDDTINFEGGVFKNGKLRMLLSRSEKTDTVLFGNTSQIYRELRLYTYDGGWTYTDLSEILPVNYESVWALQRTIQLCWDSSFDYIYVIDKTGTSDTVKEYKSIDLFQNYTYNILGDLTGDYYFGSHSHNSPTNDKRLLVLLDVLDGIDNFNSSANLKLYTPE